MELFIISVYCISAQWYIILYTVITECNYSFFKRAVSSKTKAADQQKAGDQMWY